ncbi:hypothetical protein ACFW1A_16170 [Kitasatospora sp. NPDC058965]|uniref:hypothetical protein n=1 Tax=Kitasatospora sp. NPDC058965 TaxID=3346682 RepID=UPI0036A4A378
MELLTDRSDVAEIARLIEESVTGYEPADFPDQCWVLHELTRRDPGDPAATPLRVTWADALDRHGYRLADWRFTLSDLTLAPAAGDPGVELPREGQLDRDSLAALLSVLARQSDRGLDTVCYWAQCPLEDLLNPVPIRTGTLREALDLFDRLGTPGHPFTFPANWWPADRSWFVLTDTDLSATEVLGSAELVAAVLAETGLEAVRHPRIADSPEGAAAWPPLAH